MYPLLIAPGERQVLLPYFLEIERQLMLVSGPLVNLSGLGPFVIDADQGRFGYLSIHNSWRWRW